MGGQESGNVRSIEREIEIWEITKWRCQASSGVEGGEQVCPN